MTIWLSDKDQAQAKKAFSSLWDIASRKWDNTFDNSSEEKIKELQLEINNLQEQIKILKGEDK